MRLRDLFSRAKKTVDERGGVESLKQDAAELKDIARGEGTMSEKAKRAADAVKDPGARRGEAPPPPGSTTGPPGGTPGGPPPGGATGPTPPGPATGQEPPGGSTGQEPPPGPPGPSPGTRP